MTIITKVFAREILDSRGMPTVEVEVSLASGAMGRFSVPSGASTGKREALELRDLEPKRYNGRGVRIAVNNVNQYLAPAICGIEAQLQSKIDQILIDLDGTSNKSKYGANAILGVSMAIAIAMSNELKTPLFCYLKEKGDKILPVPQMNIINGGAHADNNLDIQEFMILPIGFTQFKEALRAGAEIFYALKTICHQKSYSTLLGDEGGFAPNLRTHNEALELILLAIEQTGYKPGKEIMLALDCAASEFYSAGKYQLKAEKLILNSEQLCDYLKNLTTQYPIISIEDGMSEDDLNGWQLLTQHLGEKIQLVGDDVFVTNPKILAQGIKDHVANALLVKINQIGTLTETIQAVEMAQKAGYNTIMSHRSGETENTAIADLAIALNCNQIKTGSLARSERIAKYNQLLRIEENINNHNNYWGIHAFKKMALSENEWVAK